MVGPLKKTVRFPERGRRHFWQDKQCDNFDRMQKKSYLQSNGPAHSSICFKWQNKIEKWRQFFIRFNRYFLLNHDSEGLD
jgi:hypothetical protein